MIKDFVWFTFLFDGKGDKKEKKRLKKVTRKNRDDCEQMAWDKAKETAESEMEFCLLQCFRDTPEKARVNLLRLCDQFSSLFLVGSRTS